MERLWLVIFRFLISGYIVSAVSSGFGYIVFVRSSENKFDHVYNRFIKTVDTCYLSIFS